MSWTNELYSVYERFADKDNEIPLLPLSHSTQNAQIEITIDKDGNFKSAREVAKEDTVTVIPVTEDSGGRSSGIAAHPLADKLIYIAGDYTKYIDPEPKKKYGDYHKAYLEQLKSWDESSYTHPAVTAVRKYVEKGNVITDLVNAHVMKTDDTGKLDSTFKIQQVDQRDFFIRFKVLGLEEEKTFADVSLRESYDGYYQSLIKSVGLCYGSGKELPLSTKHSQRIRNAGDKGKLISANDESGFSYLGRFNSKEEALSISYDFSQKMHNALKWLIQKQGTGIDSMVLLAWESNLQPLPELTAKGISYEDEDSDMDEDDANYDSTVEAFKDKLQKSLFGKGVKIDPDSKTMIMTIDAATTGRDSITMYEEMPTSDFYENLQKWHEDSSWMRFNGKKLKNEQNSFSFYEIVQNAYGTENTSVDKKLQCSAYLRLLPCVISNKKIPNDIVQSLFHKACNPLAYDSKKYGWSNAVEVACGMIKKQIIEKKGECSMALDKTCTERDYLYGRLIAIADIAEAGTYKKGESRTTNARRLFNAFANHPYSTWGVIMQRLEPYLNKMDPGKRIWYDKLMQEVYDMFSKEDFENNSALKPVFLLAYNCQVRELYAKKEEKDNSDVSGESEEE